MNSRRSGIQPPLRRIIQAGETGRKMNVKKKYQVQSMNAVTSFDNLRDALIYAHGVYFAPQVMSSHDFIWIIVTPENPNDVEDGNNEFFDHVFQDEKRYFFYLTPALNKTEKPEDWLYYLSHLYGPLGKARDAAPVCHVLAYRPDPEPELETETEEEEAR